MILRLAYLVVLAGCLDRLAPDVGAPVASNPTCPGDSDPSTDTSYHDDVVGGPFRRGGCTECHTDDGLGVRQSGLDLKSYTTLRAGGGRSGAGIVVTDDPCSSVLVQKIEESPPFGRRMPYDGPPYLADADIQTIRDWIAEGARDN